MPRPKIEDGESRLLQAGLELFASQGTERVNTNSIARRAGLAVGTFYSHFPDKYALLREIELRTLSGLRAARLEAIAPIELDPVARARASVDAAVRFAARHGQAYRVTFGRERSGLARHGPVVTESARPLASALRELQSERRLDPELNAALAARAYQSMEVGTLLWWLEDTERASMTEIVETLVRLHPAAVSTERSSQASN